MPRKRPRKPRVQRRKQTVALVPVVANKRVAPTPKNAPPRGRRGRGVHLTEAGRAFLQCAFATPDFSVDPGKGIPDQFQGRVLSIKDCYTNSIDFEAGKDTWLILAPVPGYALFTNIQDIGDQPELFVGTAYPTYDTNFGNGNSSNYNYSAFRYASQCIGIYPTSNAMQTAGSITVWRVDLDLASMNYGNPTSGVNLPYLERNLIGANSIQPSAPRDNISHAFMQGLYSYAYDRTGTFEWNEFRVANRFSQGFDSAGHAGRSLLSESTSTRALPGLGNLNTIVVKVSVPTGAVCSAVVKTWCCLEMQPNTDSNIYQFSGMSPRPDPLALCVYNEIKAKLPIAVTADKNPGFWQRVLSMIRSSFAAGSMLPGPSGVISGGLDAITRGVTSMFV